MKGPVVHGPPVLSRVLLIGQAPGPHEGALGRPFAWTAGRTLFRWFETVCGLSEGAFRAGIYMAAVARCFPGKTKDGSDRRPDPAEIGACERFLVEEVKVLEPRLVLAVGALAIARVLHPEGGKEANQMKLHHVVGTARRATYHGAVVDVIALPHPSGASTWTKTEPGKTLLFKALELVAAHPEIRALPGYGEGGGGA